MNAVQEIYNENLIDSIKHIKNRTKNKNIVTQKDKKLISDLVNKGADLLYGLRVCITNNLVDIAKSIIEEVIPSLHQDMKPEEAKKMYLNKKDNLLGWGLLRELDNKQTEMVKLFLSNGADPNIQDPQGTTPLIKQVCMSMGLTNNLKVARILIEHGANPEIRDEFGKNVYDHCENLCYKSVAKVIKAEYEKATLPVTEDVKTKSNKQ